MTIIQHFIPQLIILWVRWISLRITCFVIARLFTYIIACVVLSKGICRALIHIDIRDANSLSFICVITFRQEPILKLYGNHFLAQIVGRFVNFLRLCPCVDTFIKLVVEIARGVWRNRIGGQWQLIQRAIRICVVHHLFWFCVFSEWHKFVRPTDYLLYGFISLLNLLRFLPYRIYLWRLNFLYLLKR